MNPSPEPIVESTQAEFETEFLPRLRLRTRFLLSMLVITAGLTTTSLLLVRRSVERNVRQSISVNLRNSVSAFQDFRHERETMLTSDVSLLADIPLTRAIMTSTDPVTIQDASQDVWQHVRSSSDLFVLVDRSGKVVAMHTKTPGFTREAAENTLRNRSTTARAKPATGGTAIIIFIRRSCSPSIADRRPRARCWAFS